MNGRGTFVRQGLLMPAKPPNQRLDWWRKNFFASPRDVLMTFLLVALVFYLAVPAFNWLVWHSVWTGETRAVCATISQGGIQDEGWSGACWAFIRANFAQILYGAYAQDERWRVNLLVGLTILVNIPLLMPTVGHKFINICLSLLVIPAIGWILLHGGIFDLVLVPTHEWGGLMVTLIIAYTSIAISLPLGTLLALGRRSHFMIVKTACVVFIETLRGVPLVAILFIANVLLPLFLPGDMAIDKFIRALVAVALFTAVYIAEVVRGGLQAVPQSQYEAARSLGLNHQVVMLFVILPQAYRLVIPALVNTLIGMFKDTSLVYIISMFDLLGIIRLTSLQAHWITAQTPATAFVFAGLIYWIFCFAMSRYGRFIEHYSKRT